ncbi:DUF4262 domain-containing protein [Actinomadura sp. 6N118]|uniref:DUF4262 domain-containing protein n=1 Tax=Actinomadura sp. 6N118 TaxID=3375151 RepID=UPI00378ACE87
MSDCHCILCEDHGELDDIDRQTMENVRTHGWGVINIPADDAGPGWSFSVGLWHSHRSPELAMFGLDMDVTQPVINNLGREIADGRAAADGQERHGLINDYPIHLKQIDRGWYQTFFGVAMAFYRRPPLPVIQLVWPDLDGRFPWDAETAEGYQAMQPQAWLARDAHPPGVWTES